MAQQQSRFDHYPPEWEAHLPAVVAKAYDARDGRALHQFARVVSTRSESHSNRQLAAVAHLLAFAVDTLAVQSEVISQRVRTTGAARTTAWRTGARGSTPSCSSGIREVKGPAGGTDR